MKNKVTEAKITDLHFDNKNANKHTQKGNRLIEKSISKLGFAAPDVIDKNNNIIIGNERTSVAGQLGYEDVIIVESDGTKVIAIKRTDIDINSKKGRELAIIDNHSAKESIDLDFVVIDELSKEYDISPVEWELEPMDWDIPEELAGVDMEPDLLEKLKGEDDLNYNRVIIVFSKEQTELVCKKLGIDKLKKIVYNINELFNEYK